MTKYYMSSQINHLHQTNAEEICREHPLTVARSRGPGDWYVTTLQTTPVQPGQAEFVLSSVERAALER